jgi:hypothetical protein
MGYGTLLFKRDLISKQTLERRGDVLQSTIKFPSSNIESGFRRAAGLDAAARWRDVLSFPTTNELSAAPIPLFSEDDSDQIIYFLDAAI